MTSCVEANEQPWRNEVLMKELYIQNQLSTHDIADELGCSAPTAGKWLKKFGVELRGDKNITKQKMIKDARGLARWLGHSPSYYDYDKYGKYGTTTVSNKLGAWENLKEMAEIRERDGYPPANHRRKIATSKLKSELERLKEKYGKVTVRLMESEGRYSHATYQWRFGSWNEALVELGFDVNKEREYDVEKLIDMLRGLGQMLNRVPTVTDVNEYTNYSDSTIYNHFNDFDEALEVAGFRPSRVDVNCEHCGAELSRKRCHQIKYDNFYCDIHCQSAWRSENKTGEDHWSWKGGGPWDYGDNWEEQREAAIKRDQHRCQGCGTTEQESIEEYNRELSVHHIRRINDFDTPEEANILSNLVTLCNECHMRWEGIPVKPQLI